MKQDYLARCGRLGWRHGRGYLSRFPEDEPQLKKLVGTFVRRHGGAALEGNPRARRFA